MIHFNTNFHCKASILGIPRLWKPPCHGIYKIYPKDSARACELSGEILATTMPPPATENGPTAHVLWLDHKSSWVITPSNYSYMAILYIYIYIDILYIYICVCIKLIYEYSAIFCIYRQTCRIGQKQTPTWEPAVQTGCDQQAVGSPLPGPFSVSRQSPKVGSQIRVLQSVEASGDTNGMTFL